MKLIPYQLLSALITDKIPARQSIRPAGGAAVHLEAGEKSPAASLPAAAVRRTLRLHGGHVGRQSRERRDLQPHCSWQLPDGHSH